jgi:hypothetical protein
LTPWNAIVKGAPGADAGAAGQTPEHRYVLSNIERSASKRGATAETSAPVEADRYIVTAVAGVNLAAHAHRKVRIVGHVIDDAEPPEPPDHDGEQRPAPPPATGPPRGSDITAATPASRWPSIVAASIASAGSTCTPGSS